MERWLLLAWRFRLYGSLFNVFFPKSDSDSMDLEGKLIVDQNGSIFGKGQEVRANELGTPVLYFFSVQAPLGVGRRVGVPLRTWKCSTLLVRHEECNPFSITHYPGAMQSRKRGAWKWKPLVARLLEPFTDRSREAPTAQRRSHRSVAGGNAGGAARGSAGRATMGWEAPSDREEAPRDGHER